MSMSKRKLVRLVDELMGELVLFREQVDSEEAEEEEEDEDIEDNDHEDEEQDE